MIWSAGDGRQRIGNSRVFGLAFFLRRVAHFVTFFSSFSPAPSHFPPNAAGVHLCVCSECSQIGGAILAFSSHGHRLKLGRNKEAGYLSSAHTRPRIQGPRCGVLWRPGHSSLCYVCSSTFGFVIAWSCYFTFPLLSAALLWRLAGKRRLLYFYAYPSISLPIYSPLLPPSNIDSFLHVPCGSDIMFISDTLVFIIVTCFLTALLLNCSP